MLVPFQYNIRSLLVRRVSTVMTVLGFALVVTVFLLVLSLAEGVRKTLTTAVSPRDVVALRVGAQSDVMSYVSSDQYEAIRTLPGLDRDARGEPLASPETVVLINIPRRDGKRANVIVRGVTAAGLALRPTLRVVEGRMFREGTSEAIVSSRLKERFASAEAGGTLQAGSQRWTVVGVFDAGGSPHDSEVWADLHDVQAQANRGTGFSAVLLRAADAGEARDRLIASIKGDQRVKLEALPESVYYERQMVVAKPMQYLAGFVGLLMAIGASFGAMNTMYAQVSARVREVGTMRAIGFSRRVILLSFLLEAALLALAGGILGAGIAWLAVTLALRAPTGTSNFATFSEIVFNFELTPVLLLAGVVFAIGMGFFGGLFPALRAARLRITTALRQA